MSIEDERDAAPATGWDAESEQLKLIFESVTDFAIFTTDPVGITTSWNIGAERLLGFSSQEIMGQSADVIFPPEEGGKAAGEKERRDALATGRAEDERWQMRKDGTRFWASGLMMPLADPAMGFVKILRDQTSKYLAEKRMRESEERFTQFANASSGGIWIRDAATLVMEYTSPAISRIYGVDGDTLLGGLEKWAALIVPDDRASALEHIERTWQGEPVVHEFRIQRQSDRSFRWIRNTDFPLYHHGKVQRIGGIAEDITEQKLAASHQAVLLAELQHRVRNIMAVILSITARTGKDTDSVADYKALLTGRMATLARVQALLTRAANVGVSIAAIVDEELSAQASAQGDFDASGPEVILPPKAAETITLAIHELATNSIKYGALSVPGGKVVVRWSADERDGDPWLSFDWDESGAPPRPDAAGPRHMGFGTELIEGRIPYELSGRASLTIHSGGARCHIGFPLTDAASILETGAPQPSKVFGGVIDMTGAPDLSGQTVLVLEDDYYLARDTAWALQGAGAEVLGPCASEEAARDLVAATRPTIAILDINLNGGRSFGLARELGESGVPFLFMTGYDEEVIPPDFETALRLQKPVEFRRLIEALAHAVAPRS